MDPAVTSRGVVPHFDKHLDPLMESSKIILGAPVPANFQTQSNLTRTGSLTLKTEEEIKKTNSFSVFMPMIKTFAPQFFTGAALKIVYGKILTHM